MNWKSKTSVRLLRPVGRTAGAFLIAATISMTTFAATVADYKTRVDASRQIVDQLLLDADNLDSDAARTGVEEIRRNLPASERVEWAGGSVETNNAWLAESLAKFEQPKGEYDRVAALTEIDERLEAISLAAAERLAAESGEPTKNAEKQKLNEILSREEYQKPKPEDESLFQRWYNAFLEWLRSLTPDTPQTKPGDPADFSILRLLLQILIFGAVAAIVGFLLYRLLPVLSRRFASREKSERGDRVIFGERIADDQSSGDLFREAEQLAAAGDLRGAIRKGYIALLCDLSDRRIVRLSRHKTNRDYVRDTRSHGDIHKSVASLTNAFERNWYGLRAAEQADWESFKAGYKEAVAAAGRK